MPVADTKSGLRHRVRAWKQEGATIGLVPTMGALHHGHLSLVKRIREACDKVVVSIFVNPAQFAAGEDLDAYPRQVADDLEALATAAADLAYIPAGGEIYPDGFATLVKVRDMGDILCGVHRPGHFDGVTTVVAKLLLQCAPDTAIFGEKDYQQLQIIRRMATDLDIPVTILGGKIIRDEDGLAASSRNVYLSKDERKTAVNLPRILQDAVARAPASKDLRRLERDAAAALKKAGFNSVDYVEIRDADNLALIKKITRPARILAAARIGKTRLIDNMPVDPAPPGG